MFNTNTPKRCKLIRHTTSFDGILDILEYGGTLDTISLLKHMYNKKNQDGTDLIIKTVDGYSKTGPKNMRRVYATIHGLYSDYTKYLDLSPKGHYVSIESLSWEKPLSAIHCKKVNIYYKWKILGKVKHVARALWSEDSPSTSDCIHDEPGPNGEYVLEKGVGVTDWLCVSAPIDYKDAPGYKEWSKKLETLCGDNHVKLYWVSDTGGGDNIFEIYKKYS